MRSVSTTVRTDDLLTIGYVLPSIDLSLAAASAIDLSVKASISEGMPLSAVVRWNGAEAAIFTALYQPRGGAMKWIHSTNSSLAVGDEDGDGDGDGDDGEVDDHGNSSDASRVRLLVPLGQSIHHHLLPSPSSGMTATILLLDRPGGQ